VRNRILAGLSLGVLVVEGNSRSGSLITARHAMDQGRDVFAVPGNIDLPLSEGPNGLIRRSEAKLVQDAWDVLTEYELSYPHKIRPTHLLSQRETEERLTTVQRAAQQWPAGRSSKQSAPAEPARRADLPAWADEDTPVLHRNQEEDALTDDEAAVLQALQQGEKRTADELVEATGIPLRRVMSSLTLLQIRQGVKQDGALYSAGAILRE
jgi:DNA processing protein